MTAGHLGLLIRASALCFPLLWPTRALARPADFAATLDYEAPPGCPAAAALRAIVEARLSYDPFVDGAPYRVSLSIIRSGSSLSGRIEWRDGHGQWTGDQSFSMPSGDCLRLSRTMGLALAVQIQLLSDPNAAPAADRERAPEAKPSASERASTEEKPPSNAAERSEPRVSPNPPKPRAPSPASGPRSLGDSGARSSPTGSRLRFAIGAGPAIGFGMAPTPIALGRLFGGLSTPHVSLELASEMSVPVSARRADGAGISVQFRGLSAAGCGVLERFSACLVVNAAQVRMAGENIDRPTSTHLPFVASGARAAFLQPLGPSVFVKLHADGLVILTRWTASLDDIPVWTMPRFAGTLGLDVGVQFR